MVLSGHEHNYERFAPQNPGGREDPERGIRQFVVGTGGGKGTYPILDPLSNSEVHNDDTYGVLELTLRPEGYDWEFVPVEGAVHGLWQRPVPLAVPAKSPEFRRTPLLGPSVNKGKKRNGRGCSKPRPARMRRYLDP